MRVTIKAKCSKENFLRYTQNSIECKYKNGYTYGFYERKIDAEIDKYRLKFVKIECEILKHWDVEGFITIKL